ncbi:unnamed protein product [Amoebophrya sp. A120]|nr:unnamed protein product [Amoebophrya sp. A120]|eukprot:GSA120T00007378001.1
MYDFLMHVQLKQAKKNKNALLGVPIMYKLSKLGPNKKFNEDLYEDVPDTTYGKMKELENPVKESGNVLVPEKTSAAERRRIIEPTDFTPEKLTLSDQEADVAQPLGQNAYLRALYFIHIARLHENSSNLALKKASEEAKKCEQMELNAWEYFEKGLSEDQKQMLDEKAMHNLKEVENHYIPGINSEVQKGLRLVDSVLKQHGVLKKKKKKGELPKPRNPLFISKTSKAIYLRLPSGQPGGKGPDQLRPQVKPSLRTEASRIDIRELKNVNPMQCLDLQNKLPGAHNQSNRRTDTYMLYGKEAGIVVEVSELHTAVEGCGARYPGYDLVQITGLTPNSNYSFAVKETRGYDFKKGLEPDLERIGGPPINAVGQICSATPPLTACYPMPISVIWCKILQELILIEEKHLLTTDPTKNPTSEEFLKINNQLQKQALRRILMYFTEATKANQSNEVRVRKLRFDVVARNPPFVLLQFAKVLVLRQRTREGIQNIENSTVSIFTTKTRQNYDCKILSGQLGLLQDINEVLLALDCAQRASVNLNGKTKEQAKHIGSVNDTVEPNEIIFQAISLLLIKIKKLMKFRTKPACLFQTLMNCVLALQSCELNQWDPHARKLTVFLFHQLLTVASQSRISRNVVKWLVNGDGSGSTSSGDSIQRYLQLCTVKRLESFETAPYYEKEAAEVTIKTIVGSDELSHYLNYSQGLALLTAELSFLNFSLSSEKIQKTIGGESLLCQASFLSSTSVGSPTNNSSSLLSKLPILEESALPGIDEKLIELFNKLAINPAETFDTAAPTFIPEYLELAKSSCEHLHGTSNHALGLPLYVMCLSRCKLPNLNASVDGGNVENVEQIVKQLSPEEKLFLETIQQKLDAIPEIRQIRQALFEQAKELANFGFMLRSLPHHALKFEEEDAAEKASSAAGALNPEEDEAEKQKQEKLKAERELIQLAVNGRKFLQNSPYAKWLAHLELLSTTVSIRKLEVLQFHDHQVQNFPYLDISQLAIPENLKSEHLASAGAEDVAILEKRKEIAREYYEKDPIDQAEENEQDLTLPQAYYKDDRLTKQLSLSLLKDVAARCARSSLCAANAKANYLLQQGCFLVLNALTVANPSPEECIPAVGVVGSYEDLDPDNYVGIPDMEPDLYNEFMLTKLHLTETEKQEKVRNCCPDRVALKYADLVVAQTQKEVSCEPLGVVDPKTLNPKPMSVEEEEQAIAEGQDLDNDNSSTETLWLNLGIIAQNLVKALTVMKQETEASIASRRVPGKKERKGGKMAGGAASPARAALASQQTMRGAPNAVSNSDLTSANEKDILASGEQLHKKVRETKYGERFVEFSDIVATTVHTKAMNHENWFDSTELDMQGLAKFVGFATLVFYHMRRWGVVVELADKFNQVSNGIFAETFCPFLVGAQKEICALSSKILKKTGNYIKTAKEKFDYEQSQVPRKVLRQLALLGQLSEPEKLYNNRVYYYENLQTRQKKLHSSYKQMLEFYECCDRCVKHGIPETLAVLKKNRIELNNFIHSKHKYLNQVKILDEAQDAIMKRNLEDQARLLMKAYDLNLTALKQERKTLHSVQASHELGNLKWLEADRRAASTIWSEGVDFTFFYPDSVKYWNALVRSVPGDLSVLDKKAAFEKNPFGVFADEYVPPEPETPPTTASESEGSMQATQNKPKEPPKQHRFLHNETSHLEEILPMHPTPLVPPENKEKVDTLLLSTVLIYKYCRFANSSNARTHLRGALFTYGILDQLLKALPHPLEKQTSTPDLKKIACSFYYRMREVFLDFRPSNVQLQPNVVHTGTDGLTFLKQLEFNIQTLHLTQYHTAKALLFTQLHKYVANDVLRSLEFSVTSKLLQARTLLLTDKISDCYYELLQIAKEQDLALQPIGVTKETIDRTFGVNKALERCSTAMARDNLQKFDAAGANFVKYYNSHEAPYSDENLQAIDALVTKWGLDCGLMCGTNPAPDQTKIFNTKQKFGSDKNYLMFQFLKVEFLLKLLSYKPCFPAPSSANVTSIPHLDKFVEEESVDFVKQGIADFNDKILPNFVANYPKLLTQCEQLLAQVWKDAVVLAFSGTTTMKTSSSQEDDPPLDFDPIAFLQQHTTFDALNQLISIGSSKNEEERQKLLKALKKMSQAISVDQQEFLLEIRLSFSKFYEQKGQLRAAVAEILYAQLLFSEAAKNSVVASSVDAKKQHMRLGVADVKYFSVLRLQLCKLLEKQGRFVATQDQVKQGIIECDTKSHDVFTKIELLFVRAKSYFQQGRLLEVSQEGNEGAIPSILELLDLAYCNLLQSEPSVTVIQAKQLLYCCLLQNPTFNCAKYLFAPKFRPKPPVNEDEEDFEAIAKANAMKLVSPVAAELLDLVDGGGGTTSTGAGNSKKEDKAGGHAGAKGAGASSGGASSSSSAPSQTSKNEQIGGSSASNALNSRSEKQTLFLCRLLEEITSDINAVLFLQDGSQTDSDLNFLSHYQGTAKDPTCFVERGPEQVSTDTDPQVPPAGVFKKKKKIFRNLLPVSEHAFMLNKEKSHNDGRSLPNIYCTATRMKAITLLQLSDYKLTVCGRKDENFERIEEMETDPKKVVRKVFSHKAEHKRNRSMQFLLEAGAHLKEIEALCNSRRLLFFPTRYFVYFSKLKLKFRRLALLENRVPRPVFESLDPVLEFYLENGIVPDSLDVSLYRSFLLRAAGGNSSSTSSSLVKQPVVKPNYRWNLDYFTPEKLKTSLLEVHSVLTIAVREGGQSFQFVFDLLYESVLEILHDWTEFVDLLPQCNRLAGKMIFLPGTEVDSTYRCTQLADEGTTPSGEITATDSDPETTDTELPEAQVLLRRYKSHFVGLVYMVFSILKEFTEKKQKLASSVVEIATANADGNVPNSGLKSFFANDLENQLLGNKVQEDLYQHLIRQKFENGLEQFFKEQAPPGKVLPPTAVMVLQYFLSTRKEVDAFQMFDENTVQLADGLHLMLAKYLPNYEQNVLAKATIDRLAALDPFVDTTQVLSHYKTDAVTNDADEATRTKIEDVPIYDVMNTPFGSLNAQEGEICFFWSHKVEESNVVDYCDNGCSAVILLRDFSVVYKVRGFVDRKVVRSCYDLWAKLQKNATSTVLEGFTRSCFTTCLKAFGRLFFDDRLLNLEALLPEKPQSGVSNEAAEIARQEAKGFKERSDVVQDHFEDLPERDENPEPPPPPKRKPKKKTAEQVKEIFEKKLELAVSILLDAITYQQKIDTYTGLPLEDPEEAGKPLLDQNVLHTDKAKDVLNTMVALLNTERRFVTSAHKDVTIFLRSILPEEMLVVKEPRYYK